MGGEIISESGGGIIPLQEGAIIPELGGGFLRNQHPVKAAVRPNRRSTFFQSVSAAVARAAHSRERDENTIAFVARMLVLLDGMKLSGHDAEGMKSSADRATPHEGRDHSDLEAKDRNRCPERQYETPNVEAGKDRRVEAEAESADMARGPKHRVNGKPDGKVEDDADDSRRYRRERAGQRFVAPKLFDVGSAGNYP
jgi:hypothetical protein